jgi:hypothetical protein
MGRSVLQRKEGVKGSCRHFHTPSIRQKAGSATIRIPYARAFFAFPDNESGSAATRRSVFLVTPIWTIMPRSRAYVSASSFVARLPSTAQFSEPVKHTLRPASSREGGGAGPAG